MVVYMTKATLDVLNNVTMSKRLMKIQIPLQTTDWVDGD